MIVVVIGPDIQACDSFAYRFKEYASRQNSIYNPYTKEMLNTMTAQQYLDDVENRIWKPFKSVRALSQSRRITAGCELLFGWVNGDEWMEDVRYRPMIKREEFNKELFADFRNDFHIDHTNILRKTEDKELLVASLFDHRDIQEMGRCGAIMVKIDVNFFIEDEEFPIYGAIRKAVGALLSYD